MTKKLLIAAAMMTSGMFVSATDASASAPQLSEQAPAVKPVQAPVGANFDCGALNTSQLTELQSKTTSTGLRDLAKQCDEQAEEYELKANDALSANKAADVSFLREKAANAYMNVAVFTNSSLFKN